MFREELVDLCDRGIDVVRNVVEVEVRAVDDVQFFHVLCAMVDPFALRAGPRRSCGGGRGT